MSAPITSSPATYPMPVSKFPELYKENYQLKNVKQGYKFKFPRLLLSYVLVPGLALYGCAQAVALFGTAWSIGTALLIGAMVYYLQMPDTVYLLDFTTYKADPQLQCSHERLNKMLADTGSYSQESLEFQRRLLATSSIGDESSFPPGVMSSPVDMSLKAARQEAEMVLFGCVQELLSKTGIQPSQIDVLVVNCSLFCPTPSLASMIVNHFRFRPDILSYSLGGMGCSASPIAIDLAKRVLQTQRNSLALVCSTENITQNWYHGEERGMLISNTLFRMGGAAVLLSNRSSDANWARFKLEHIVRTHKGNSDACFRSVYQEEDNKGFLGVRLSKDIMDVAGQALKKNIETLAPLILPVGEQIKFFVNHTARQLLGNKLPRFVPATITKVLYGLARGLLFLPRADDQTLRARIARSLRGAVSLPVTPMETADESDRNYVGPPYLPDFTRAVQHFCIHTGGRAVLDAMEKNLGLSSKYLEASRATLRRYGNTSSSSIWYELEYHLQHSGVQPGHRVWQIAFGSGFKCNSAVWECVNAR